MLYLAQQKRVVSSSEMSSMMNISQRYVLSISKKLCDDGYVSVGYGLRGGYSVAKPLEDISLYDIIMLMEGSIPISRCQTKENHCEDTPCLLHCSYCLLESIIKKYLCSLTLEMLVEQPVSTWQNTVMSDINTAFCSQ